ncbi:MAG TPA: response regulator [Treponemataceae bacterium]|jgi:two-component system response regulator YesN|nr:response regulator [Treponemataceae bacterium]
MYKVFIVDDEVIVREGIRNKIQWDETPFTFAGEAGDGEIALSMIQEIKPDILITDIKMPFMDGLQLSMIVKSIQPWIRIIILSGHDEFDYAKEAIKIGVDDYILKPFSSEDLMISMLKASRKIDQQKNRMQNPNLESEINTSKYIHKQSFLHKLLTEPQSTDSLIQQSAALSLDLDSPFFIVCISRIHNADKDVQTLQNIKHRIHDVCENMPHVLLYTISFDRFAFILKSSTREKIEEESFSFAQTIQHEVQLEKNSTVIIAIGSIAENPGSIAQSFSHAESIINACKISGKNRIFCYGDIHTHENSSLILQEHDPVVEQLKYASLNEVEKIVDGYISLLGENPGHFGIIASYLLIEVIMAVSKLVEELGDNIQNVMPRILTRDFVTHSVETPDILIKEVNSILHEIIKWRDNRSSGRYADVILKAKKYIEENYNNPSVCLQTVSAHVCLSPNHFSTVFSQECGMTFIEYLTEIRMTMAKKLLKTTQKRSTDIAYEIGFSDPHYFSYIFKKHTGMSPREYRQ